MTLKRKSRKIKSLKLSNHEKNLLTNGYRTIIGIDEVGRGCMAGPLVICGYAYTPLTKLHNGVNDSKILSRKQREYLFPKLIKNSHHIVEVGVKELDQIGLTKSIQKAINEIKTYLFTEDSILLIDGKDKFGFRSELMNIIDGDASIYSIAAASIIAKVYRDRIMYKYAEIYPQYGFEKHVGYCTKSHLEAIKIHGVLEIHRKSFKPVTEIYEQTRLW